MGSKHEKQHPHRQELQRIANELGAQQTLGVVIGDGVSDEMQSKNQLDLGRLLSGNRRFERAHTDAAWIHALFESPIRAKHILEIWKRKDKISRKLDKNKS